MRFNVASEAGIEKKGKKKKTRNRWNCVDDIGHCRSSGQARSVINIDTGVGRITDKQESLTIICLIYSGSVKAKGRRSLARCRLDYVSSSLFETCAGSRCYLPDTYNLLLTRLPVPEGRPSGNWPLRSTRFSGRRSEENTNHGSEQEMERKGMLLNISNMPFPTGLIIPWY